MYKYPGLGTIIHATLRDEDLIPAFIDAIEPHLAQLDPGMNIAIKDLISRWNRLDDAGIDEYCETDESSYDLDELFNALDSIAPPYMYFGAHVGDGSDFGYWISDDAIEMGKQDRELTITEDLTKYTLQVNDHGNMELYKTTHEPIWSCV
jgi:hypothetical protein